MDDDCGDGDKVTPLLQWFEEVHKLEELRNGLGWVVARCMLDTGEEQYIEARHIEAEHTVVDRIEAEGIKAVHIGAVHMQVIRSLVVDIPEEDILTVNKQELMDIIQGDIEELAGVGIIRVTKEDISIAVRVGTGLVDNYLVAF